MSTPYYQDESVTLYLGDCRDVLPALDIEPQLVVTDPPYGETSLVWDRWPDGWPSLIADMGAPAMWCFGSMRMFLDRRDDFAAWRLSQDIVWEKHNGSGFHADRFKRVHEHALHWYRGDWAKIQHDAQRVTGGSGNKSVRKRGLTPHTGTIGDTGYIDDGTRLVRSVIYAPSMQQRALHPTEKPIGILDSLIRYGTAPGDLVLDPFAGSGGTLDAARCAGRRAIGIEADERYAEAAAKRLSQASLFGGAA